MSQYYVNNGQPAFLAGEDAPLTTGQFLGMLFLCAIPLVNIIMLLVWAFGDGNRNRKSFARAVLLFNLIVGAVSVVVALLFMSALIPFFSSLSGYVY